MKKCQKNIILVIEFIAFILSVLALKPLTMVAEELFSNSTMITESADFALRFAIFPAIIVVIGVVVAIIRRSVEGKVEDVPYALTKAVEFPVVCYVLGLGAYLINSIIGSSIYDGPWGKPNIIIIGAIVALALILFVFFGKVLYKNKKVSKILGIALLVGLGALVFMAFINTGSLNHTYDKWVSTYLIEAIAVCLICLIYYSSLANALEEAVNAPAEEKKAEPVEEKKAEPAEEKQEEVAPVAAVEEEKEPEMKAVVDFKAFYAAKEKDFGPEVEQPEEAPKEVEADDEELFAMHKFAKEALEAKGYDLNEKVEVEKVVEVEKIVEVEKVVEKEVQVEVAPVKEPKAPKEKKEILPSPQTLLKYVKDNFTDTVIIVDEDDESFKAYRGKKMFINLKASAQDYKITFQRKPISITRLLTKYPTITKATSPAGDQWFKLVNKGNFEEEDLQNIIKFSYTYLVDEEEKAALKKQKEKEKAAEKRKKEREKAKAAAAKEKAKAAAAKAKEEKEAKEA